MDPDDVDFLPDPKYTPISSLVKPMPKFNPPPPAKLSKKKVLPTKPVFKIPENKFLTKNCPLTVAKENNSNRTIGSSVSEPQMSRDVVTTGLGVKGSGMAKFVSGNRRVDLFKKISVINVDGGGQRSNRGTQVNNEDRKISDVEDSLTTTKSDEKKGTIVECSYCKTENKLCVFSKKSQFLRHLSVKHFSIPLLQAFPFSKENNCILCYESSKKMYTPNKLDVHLCHVGVVHAKIVEILPSLVLQQVLGLPSSKKSRPVVDPNATVGINVKERSAGCKNDMNTNCSSQTVHRRSSPALSTQVQRTAASSRLSPTSARDTVTSAHTSSSVVPFPAERKKNYFSLMSKLSTFDKIGATSVSAVKRKAKLLSEQVKSSKVITVCTVCGDESHELACKVCLTFFRCSTEGRLVLICQFGGGCEVNMYTRKQCMACWRQKCSLRGLLKLLDETGKVVGSETMDEEESRRVPHNINVKGDFKTVEDSSTSNSEVDDSDKDPTLHESALETDSDSEELRPTVFKQKEITLKPPSQQPFSINQNVNERDVEVYTEEVTSDDISEGGKIKTKCTNCSRKFLNLGSLIKHSKTCTKSFPCLKCGKIMKSLKNLKEHVKSLHFSEPKFTCESCQLRFRSRAKVTSHMKIHSEVKCPVCEKIFKSKNVLKVHKYKAHNESGKQEKEWTCPVCFKVYTNDRSFRFHKALHVKAATEDADKEDTVREEDDAAMEEVEEVLPDDTAKGENEAVLLDLGSIMIESGIIIDGPVENIII